jgi:hypothetical protein
LRQHRVEFRPTSERQHGGALVEAGGKEDAFLGGAILIFRCSTPITLLFRLLARKPAASVEKLAGVRLARAPDLASAGVACAVFAASPPGMTSPVFGSQTVQLDTRSSVLTPT